MTRKRKNEIARRIIMSLRQEYKKPEEVEAYELQVALIAVAPEDRVHAYFVENEKKTAKSLRISVQELRSFYQEALQYIRNRRIEEKRQNITKQLLAGPDELWLRIASELDRL